MHRAAAGASRKLRGVRNRSQSHRGGTMDVLTLRKRLTYLAVASSLCIAATAVSARVTKITIDSTTPVAGGPFGAVGNYELLRGTASGEIDPSDRHNVGITDIEFAPKNASGKVEYKAQFSI